MFTLDQPPSPNQPLHGNVREWAQPGLSAIQVILRLQDVEPSSHVFGPVSWMPSCWVWLADSAGVAEQPPPGSNSLSQAALPVSTAKLATSWANVLTANWS